MKDKIIEKLGNESKGLSLIEINDLLNLAESIISRKIRINIS